MNIVLKGYGNMTLTPTISYGRKELTKQQAVTDDANKSSAIDWSEIRTHEDLAKINPKLLYEDTKVYSPTELLQLNPNLNDDELEDAIFWSKFRRGVLIITGQPRQGKSTLAHLIVKKMNYYFKMLPVLDTRPRTIFGSYVPFSQDMLDEQIIRMDRMEKGFGHVREDGSWTTDRGDVFLRNAAIFMDEFGSKYMSRRDAPNLAIKKSLLKLFDYWGHAQCLWIGAGISIDDIDRRCLDKIVWEARCTRIFDAEECEENPETIIIGSWISPIKFNPFKDSMEIAGEPVPLRINSSKEQKCLNSKAWKDIFKTDNAQGFTLGKKRSQ